MNLTKPKDIKAALRKMDREERKSEYLTLRVDGEIQTYKLSHVAQGERGWWRKAHPDLGPRYHHSRWHMVRLQTPYKSPHWVYVDGRATTYSNQGRTRGEVIRVAAYALIRRDGVKVVEVLDRHGKVRETHRA